MYSTKDLVEKVSYQCGALSNAAVGCIHMKIKSWNNFRLPHLAVSACSTFLVMENKLTFCTGDRCVQKKNLRAAQELVGILTCILGLADSHVLFHCRLKYDL